MKNKTVTKTSIFETNKSEMFKKLQEFKTLQYIAYPFATFEATDRNNDLVWEAGKEFAFHFKLFGLIPFGIHRICVVRFDEDEGIYTKEGNKHVPIWNHEILLETLDEDHVRYTDRVEICAGWKTPFVFLWAYLFYSHRQRKWKKLL